jgi:beta-lactamase class A
MLLNLRKDKDEGEDIQDKKDKGSGETPVTKPRKKKEVRQPWGKRERIIVFLLIIVTVGTSAILAISSRSWKLPGLPRISVPNISLFQEETIIIEKDKISDGDSTKPVQNFENKTKGLSGVYGLYLIDLDTNTHMGVYKKESFKAASLIKLPVMAAMLQEAEFGNLDLNEEYVLKETDKTAGSGSLYDKDEGYIVTYGELVELMGKESDNTAFSISVDLLGEEKIEKVQEQFGMTDTSIDDNSTTPADIASFFQKIYESEVLTKPNSEKIISYLTDTAYEEWLTAGVPRDVVVSHKYGAIPQTVNDAGIVYAGKPYVVVIVSKGVVAKEADKVFPELSEGIYSDLQND